MAQKDLIGRLSSAAGGVAEALRAGTLSAYCKGKLMASVNACLGRIGVGCIQMNLPDIDGRSLCAWAQQWQRLGVLKGVAKTAPCDVGLYRATLRQQIVYVGVATEHENRGLRKRLTDYVRESDSGRKNKAGRCLHRHADVLCIDVLTTGTDSHAAESARRLEHGFIFVYQPAWNFLERG